MVDVPDAPNAWTDGNLVQDPLSSELRHQVLFFFSSST